MKDSVIVAVFSLAVVFGAAQAHDAWIAPVSDGYAVIWGHADDTSGYETGNVKEVKVYDINWQPVPFKRLEQDKKVSIDPSQSPAAITMLFDSGNLVITKDEEYVSGSKQDHEDYMDAFHSQKYAKSLFQWHEAAGKPMGLELEIVPLVNPYTLDKGDSLPVQVLYQGKPLPGVEIGYSDKEDSDKVMTNGQGKAELPARTVSVTIYTRHRIPMPNDPDIDTRSLSANLFIAAR